jgi:hypothetical protein
MAADRHPVRVELVGFDERHRATLDVLFQGPGKGACTIVAGGQAQAAIIDVDRIGGLAGWEAYRRTHPDAPTAIVSIYDKNRVDGEIFLRKPVKIDDMLYAVAAIRARLLGTAAPTARAEPLTSSAFTRSATDPKSETVWPQAVPRSVMRARRGSRRYTGSAATGGGRRSGGTAGAATRTASGSRSRGDRGADHAHPHDGLRDRACRRQRRRTCGTSARARHRDAPALRRRRAVERGARAHSRSRAGDAEHALADRCGAGR